MSAGFVIGFIALLALLVLGYQFAGRYALDYSLSERGIYLRLFRILKVKLVHAAAITSCSVTHASELVIPFDLATLFAWRLGNRFAATVVVVRTRRWFMRALILTPRAPERFCADVAELIARHGAK